MHLYLRLGCWCFSTRLIQPAAAAAHTWCNGAGRAEETAQVAAKARRCFIHSKFLCALLAAVMLRLPSDLDDVIIVVIIVITVYNVLLITLSRIFVQFRSQQLDWRWYWKGNILNIRFYKVVQVHKQCLVGWQYTPVGRFLRVNVWIRGFRSGVPTTVEA